MKKVTLCALLCALAGIGTAHAQNTLNIHQKNGSVVSYSFADNPMVTYVGDNLHVSTYNVSIEYPLSELDKLTFSDSESSIGELRVEESRTPILIYDANGRLIKRISEAEGDSSFNTQELSTGIYYIKQGTITTKIIKQ